MGNFLFTQPTKAADDLQAGTYTGKLVNVEKRTGDDDNAFVIFFCKVRNGQNVEDVSGSASYDLKKTRKFVRWLLAANGLTPETAPDDVDLAELKTEGPVLIDITYMKQERQENGKYQEVRGDFPRIKDIRPVPRDTDDDIPF